MELTWVHIVILIISGLIVGFINTIAGGGTIISLSVFMFFGLPPSMANGTNRLAILFQNSTAVTYFAKKKVLPWNKALRYSIPVVLGSIVGALLANIIPNNFFNYIFGVVVVLFGMLLILQPEKWLKEQENIIEQPIRFWHYILLFIIGIYGGFIHIGIGYMFLMMMTLGMGNDLGKANILKNFLVLSYIPFTLIVFAIEGNVNWAYGLIHSIGNIIGAHIGARLALKKGSSFIRYIMIALIAIVILQLFGIINPENIYKWINNR